LNLILGLAARCFGRELITGHRAKMLLTVLVLFLFAGSMVASLFLITALLWIGLRWAKAQNPLLHRCLLAIFVWNLLQLPIVAAGFLLVPSNLSAQIALAFFELLVQFAIQVLVVAYFFNLKIVRAFQAWSLTFVGIPVIFAFVLLIFRPFLIEAYKISSNSMAPSLVGDHLEGICPDCGNRTYCSVPTSQWSPEPLMICDKNFHVALRNHGSDEVHGADRLIVTKFLSPQRWDIVVFKYPENPSVVYVMRIVGLPGEEITVKEGRVYANGNPLDPPDSIHEIRYLSQVEGYDGKIWGAEESPAKLDDDEYFVLGDFSNRSQDSRLWRQGAPNHHPYAVPATNIVGVVSHVYWPPNRWKAFR
jgi:signal peptidase I